MTRLGKAVGILLRHEQREHEMHADVDAFYAPSECHALVSRGEEQRRRQAMRHACHVAGVRNRRLLRRRVRAVVSDAAIYRHFGHVPY